MNNDTAPRRLLDKGFTEMGFGRLGNAVPLGEAISLVAFDTNVPDVLENLRAARQPDDCRQVCMKFKFGDLTAAVEGFSRRLVIHQPNE